MPANMKPKPGYRPPADLYEAVERWIEAKGRWCRVCLGSSPASDGHDRNPACEAGAAEDVRQRFAETRPLPGESEDVAVVRIVRRLYDDVARTVEVRQGPSEPAPIRFDHLTSETRDSLTRGLRGLVASLAATIRDARGVRT